MKILSLAFLLLLNSLLFAAPQPGQLVTSGSSTEKKLALSFDDGPGPWTERFLDLLDQYKVKATFFMEAEQVGYRSKLAKMVAERGHEIGNHTLKHINYLKRSKDERRSITEVKAELLEDMNKSRAIIERATEIKLKICRMPHGVDRPWVREVAKEAGFVLVNWTYGADWTQTSDEELEKSYVKAIQPGAILLFHDGGKNREKSLRLTAAVLKAAQEKGYKLTTVGELVGIE